MLHLSRVQFDFEVEGLEEVHVGEAVGIVVSNQFALFALKVTLLFLQKCQLVVKVLPLRLVDPLNVPKASCGILRQDCEEPVDVELENCASLADALGAVGMITDTRDILQAEHVARAHDHQVLSFSLTLFLLDRACSGTSYVALLWTQETHEVARLRLRVFVELRLNRNLKLTPTDDV